MTSSTDEAGIRVSQVNRRQAIGSIAAGLTSSGAVWKASPKPVFGSFIHLTISL